MRITKNSVTTSVRVLLALTISGAAAPSAWADAEARLPDDSSQSAQAVADKPFKLWAGHYNYSPGSAGTDVNVRYRNATIAAWAGVYGDAAFGQQARAGLEKAITPLAGVPLSLQFSGQIASRGFVGGGVTVEYGEPWFVLAGLGRTNLRSYFNLNFDPNDAVSLALGWRGSSGLTLYGLVVRDNRLNDGQQHLHLVARLPLPDRQRLTVDLLRKSGLDPELGSTAWGLSLTWDLREWSIRLASDRRQNFTEVNATRLSLGYRF